MRPTNLESLLAKTHADLDLPAKTHFTALIAFPVNPRCSPLFPTQTGTRRARRRGPLDSTGDRHHQAKRSGNLKIKSSADHGSRKFNAGQRICLRGIAQTNTPWMARSTSPAKKQARGVSCDSHYSFNIIRSGRATPMTALGFAAASFVPL